MPFAVHTECVEVVNVTGPPVVEVALTNTNPMLSATSLSGANEIVCGALVIVKLRCTAGAAANARALAGLVGFDRARPRALSGETMLLFTPTSEHVGCCERREGHR